MIRLAIITACLLPIGMASATVFLDNATYFANLPVGGCFQLSGVTYTGNTYRKIEDDRDHSFRALNTKTWEVDRSILADMIVRVCKR